MQDIRTDDFATANTRIRRLRLSVAAAIVAGASILSVGVAYAEGCLCG